MQTCVCSTGTKCGPWRVTVWSGLRFEIYTFNKGNFDSSCVGSPNGTICDVHRPKWEAYSAPFVLKPRANESTASKKLKNVVLAFGINSKLVSPGSRLRYPCYMTKRDGSSANGPLI